MPDAARSTDRLLIAIATLALAASTLLLSRSATNPSIDDASPPALAPFAGIITIPLPMPTASEIRIYVLPLALAALLLAAALARSEPSPIAPARWFERAALAVAVLAVASAMANQTWPLSRGWILLFGAGAAWAAMLCRRAATRTVAIILLGAAAVAIAAAALTLAHRQMFGIRHVRWPIGPIAVSSEVAAAWAAAALGAIIAFLPQRSALPARARLLTLAASSAVACAAITLLVVTERIAPAIALGVAIAWAAVLQFSGRSARRYLVPAGLTALIVAAGAAWLVSRADRAGSLSVRLAYWKTIADRFPGWTALGAGPDMFVVTSTNDLARARAETPHPLHGTLERSAHNEWLQAGFELGLAGGILYAALPLGALVAAFRAWPRAAPPARIMLAATSSGLVALVAAEAANVNLRYGTIPAWYWTLIGLTLALAGAGRTLRPAPAWLPRRSVIRLAAAGLSIIVLLVTLTDISAAYAQARGDESLASDDLAAMRWYSLAAPRLGAEQWLKVRAGLAAAASNLARQSSGAATQSAAIRETAVAAWSELVHHCPGYHGAGGLLAEAQLQSGNSGAAQQTLAKYLEQIDPYDASANLLFAQTFAPDAPTRLECLLRAARASAITGLMISQLQSTLADPAARSSWAARAAAAEADAARPEPEWKNPLNPEILRLEAARCSAAGDRASAARIGKLAADAYLKLYNDDNPRRRPAEAEADAFARAAEDLFRSDPSQYQTAYGLICNAERFAVLGGELEKLRNPDPNAEFVGGQVVPTDLSDIYRPLWRLSALLHLAAGRVQNLELRIRSSLPEDRWSQAHIDAVWVELARELVAAFATLPPDRRPKHYDRLVRLASAAPVASQPASQRP